MEAMRSAGVARIVFSSTCATYGEPEEVPIRESQPQRPINPYGFTKLVIEHALADYARAYGWGYAALRYFNAAGASADGDLGEDHDPETHLIPLVLQVALGQRDHVMVFGEQFPTPDGTCIRDYIHVEDLATAHLSALAAAGAGRGAQAQSGHGAGIERERGHRDVSQGDRPSHPGRGHRPPRRRSSSPGRRSQPGPPRAGLAAAIYGDRPDHRDRLAMAQGSSPRVRRLMSPGPRFTGQDGSAFLIIARFISRPGGQHRHKTAVGAQRESPRAVGLCLSGPA